MDRTPILNEFAKDSIDVRIKTNEREDLYLYTYMVLKALRQKNEVVISALLSCRWIIETIMIDFTTDSDGKGFVTYPTERLRRIKLSGIIHTKTGKPYEVYILVLKRHASLEK